MKRIVCLFSMMMMVFISTQFVYAHGDEHSDKMGPMAAAERALHKSEMLVSVRMLDKSFVQRLQNVSVTDNVDSDRYFVALFQQEDSKGKEKSVSLFYGYENQFLGYHIHDYKNFTAVPDQTVSPTRVAEKAIHKIENLIEKNDVEESFSERFERLEIREGLVRDFRARLVSGFKVVVTQREDDHGDEDGDPAHLHEAPSITLYFNAAGYFIRYEV